MNKKGFASSTIIYGLLSIFLIAISILICTMNSNVRLNRSLNEKTVENIEYGSSSISELENRITELEGTIIDKIYPVGSIYISTTDSTVDSVEQRFGGTWVRYATDTTLVGYKEGTNTINGTGGSKTTTISYTPKGNVSNYSGNSGSTVLTIDQIPAHDHKGMTWYDTQIVGLHSGTATGVYLSYSNGASESTATGLRSGWTGGSQGHTHTINHSHTFTGTKENLNINVQDPYTVVYMYKRTA